MIHARFFLQAITLRSFPHASAEFGAVCRGEANRAWAKATPVGKLTLGSLDQAEVDWLMVQRADIRPEHTQGTEFDLLLSRGEQPEAPIVRRLELMGVERERYDPENGGTVKFESLHSGPYVEWTMKLARNAAWETLSSAWGNDQVEWWLAITR